ncbi:hypothetical protein G7Z17_g155 [Cylindrodendrum hubeiense]|uniref:Acyltransferase 3 domain-containing protein n=1 Tax=Cylindrodendrum hubeiense TaxID=595255 RepID=A0A9P5LMR9_9HYPO|nr:hypothetical protein G7Z17_g155 [Cylindrodendrum hubeiense]
MSSLQKGILNGQDWDEKANFSSDLAFEKGWKPATSAGSYKKRFRRIIWSFWPKSPPPDKKLRPTAYLDGLRGFAAFLVYIQHHELWVHDSGDLKGAFENAFGYDGKFYFASFYGIRHMFTGGHYAVVTFFVISGYVLSVKPLSLIQAGEYVQLGDTIASALFRRWLRLFLPLIVTVLLSVTVYHTFGMWIKPLKMQRTLWDEFWTFYIEFKNFSFVYKGGGEPWLTYNRHLWSIPVEFKGSIVVYTSLMAFSRCSRTARLWCEVALIYYFMYITDGWACSTFMAGMLLCDLDLLAKKGELPRFLVRLEPAKMFIYYHLLVFGLFLGGVPSQNSNVEQLARNRGWYYLSYLKPQAVFDYKWFYLFWAAVFLVASVPRIHWLKSFFETRVCQYLGRISFGLYLIHGPVLWTLGDRLYVVMGWVVEEHLQHIPHWANKLPIPKTGPAGLEISYLLPHIVLLPVTLGLAELVTRAIDTPSVKFASQGWSPMRLTVIAVADNELTLVSGPRTAEIHYYYPLRPFRAVADECRDSPNSVLSPNAHFAEPKMLMRDIRRLSLFTGSIIFLIYFGIHLYSHSEIPSTEETGWVISPAEPVVGVSDSGQPQEEAELPTTTSDVLEVPATPAPTPKGDIIDAIDTPVIAPFGLPSSDVSHQEVFSLSTKDTKFFVIDFGGLKAINPNIIPHPTAENTWIVVAQQVKEMPAFFTEVFCNAMFQDGVLRCLYPPMPLPIAATAGERCEGELSFMNSISGPHDARVFFGPTTPYIVYGSNSIFTCLGQFIQDFRMIIEWGPDNPVPADFRIGTELQRPLPWSTMEKNWFVFWDMAGGMYIHYDIAPKRVFSAIGTDGSAGPDLAPFAEVLDEQCLAKYLPKLASELESIHQATNSLQITMCKKQDASCVQDESNTFILTIFQHKTYYDFHGVYDPYVVLFQQRAPFEIHAISQQPIWIHGREKHVERKTSDMFYVTSISWKDRSQGYHGYLDDELFLAFGIEDERAGGIDLLAGHLLENLGLCREF